MESHTYYTKSHSWLSYLYPHVTSVCSCKLEIIMLTQHDCFDDKWDHIHKVPNTVSNTHFRLNKCQFLHQNCTFFLINYDKSLWIRKLRKGHRNISFWQIHISKKGTWDLKLTFHIWIINFLRGDIIIMYVMISL